jgi:uncharacterized protein (TIGR03083 family)
VSVTTTTAPAGTTPRRPALDRTTAHRLAATEYQRVVDQLRSLSDDEWRIQTCNTGWDVRALAAHMLGMVAMAASVPEQLRQMRAAKKRGGEFIDALTALQVEKYDGWSGDQIVAEFVRLAPKAVKGRSRTPGLLRGRKMPQEQPVNPPDGYESWTFAYLVDVILTRDPWMHRSDIAVATGREMTLTADHDAVIVDDVVREWAGRHAQSCGLTLTGPIGREYVFGTGGPSYAIDAVEFCRMASGRGTGEGLLRTRVPF